MENPYQRYRMKTSQETVQRDNDRHLGRQILHAMESNPVDTRDEEDAKFWDDLARELDDHSNALQERERHSRKLAETIRTTKVTKKAEGRTVPNTTHYIQVITRKSDRPFPKS